MNLRDLIFSQSTAPALLTTRYSDDIPSPPFSPLPFPMGKDSSSSEDEPEPENDAQKIQVTNIPKYMGRYPLIRNKNLAPKHYRGCPEIKHSKEIQKHKFMPGFDFYVKYSQVDRSILSLYRDIVRSLWNKCYYAKDIEGATMAIKVLAEVDSIGQKDLIRFTELLRYQPDPITAMKVLLQGSIKQRVIKKRRRERVTLITMFTELFMLHNDVSSARMFVQGRLADSAFNSSSCLLAFDPIIVCNQIILEALSLSADLHQPISTLPTVEAVLAEGPLALYRSVRFLHVLSALAAHRVKCSQMLGDLRSAFHRCSLLSSKCEWMDLHALYVAYLEGTRQHKMALKHLRKVGRMLLKSAEVSPAVSDTEPYVTPLRTRHSGDVGGAPKVVLQKYRKLLLQHTAMFGSASVMRRAKPVSQSELVREVGEAVVTGSMQWLRVGTQTLDQSEWPCAVYVGIQLYRLKRVTRSFLVSLISDCIERHTTPAEGQPYASAVYCCLWRLLSALVSCGGLVQSIGTQDAVEENSDLAPLMTESSESWLDRSGCSGEWREGVIHQDIEEEEHLPADAIINTDKEEQRMQSEEGFVDSIQNSDNVDGANVRDEVVDEVEDTTMKVDDIESAVGEIPEDKEDIDKGRGEPDGELVDFLSSRAWWSDSLLSVSRLGSEFSDSVLEFEATKVIRGLMMSSDTAGLAVDVDQVLTESSALFREGMDTPGSESATWMDCVASFNAALSDLLGEGIESGEDASRAYDSDSSSDGSMSSVVILAPALQDVVIKTEKVDLPQATPAATSVAPPQMDLLLSIQALNNANSLPAGQQRVGTSPAPAVVASQLIAPRTARRQLFPSKAHQPFLDEDPIHSSIKWELCLLSSGLSGVRPREDTSLSSHGSGRVSRGSYSFLSPVYWSPGEAAILSDFNGQTTQYTVLGSRAFACVVDEVIVSCYLYTQDCLFVVKGIQMLLENLMHTEYVSDDLATVRNSMRKLINCGVNCTRAVRLASQLAQRDAEF